ncbi:MAG: FadR family transcriptional regulator [Fusobacteriaceae bacterium]|jgi:GntR family transcriptional repressor for pyruvate dehydrogenase complex|nr:FadR family transcriptional regulator [Fusobacteriaceae bacterium]
MEKIIRENLTDQIYERLKSNIVEGIWKKGDKIPSEIELSKQLGVSRMSLRMAIQKLNNFGLIKTLPGDGTYVKDFSITNFFSELFELNLMSQEAGHIYEFMYVLECDFIKLAMEKENVDKEIKNLEDILSEMEETAHLSNWEHFHDADYRFHLCICNMAGNVVFNVVYDALSNLLFNTIKSNTDKAYKKIGNLNSVLKYHRNVFNGLKNHDLDACLKSEKKSYEITKIFYNE